MRLEPASQASKLPRSSTAHQGLQASTQAPAKEPPKWEIKKNGKDTVRASGRRRTRPNDAAQPTRPGLPYPLVHLFGLPSHHSLASPRFFFLSPHALLCTLQDAAPPLRALHTRRWLGTPPFLPLSDFTPSPATTLCSLHRFLQVEGGGGSSPWRPSP
jgi:hypothetical protein